MEKKILKIVKLLLFGVYVVIFLGLLALQLWAGITESGFFVSWLIYWMILLGWLFILFNFKLESEASFILGFVTFVFAAIFAILGLRLIAETVMRVGFIFWLVGMGQALIEYQKTQNNNQNAKNKNY